MTVVDMLKNKQKNKKQNKDPNNDYNYNTWVTGEVVVQEVMVHGYKNIIVPPSKTTSTHSVMKSPSHILQIAVIQEGVAVHLHPHTDLLNADGSNLRDGIPGNNKWLKLTMCATKMKYIDLGENTFLWIHNRTHL